ncbi:MAG: DUF4136 domain-containing protein [Sphingobacteriales bacterium]|nr:MAG: DUF4136 domain-containing protein [Sphingobacteriales bacterium]
MKRVTTKWLGLLSAAFIILSSCNTATHIEKDKNADFSGYKNFAWLDVKNTKSNNDLVERQVMDAVTKELEKEGWRQVKNNPDVLLNYDLMIEKTVKQNRDAVYSQPINRLVYNPYTRRWTTIYYPSQFVGYENSERPVKQGTITITMIDAKTDRTVWQGWTTEEVNSRHITNKEIQNSVRSIFRKFDVAKN